MLLSADSFSKRELSSQLQLFGFELGSCISFLTFVSF